MNKHIALLPALAGIALMSGADASNLRIIGGSKVNINQYPYMTGLVGRGDPATEVFCGASVINSQWILTAAHCIVDTQANSLDVVTGIDTLSNPGQGQRLQASEIIIHPDYNNNTVLNDIALIKLSTPTDAPAIRAATGKDENLFATNQPVSVAGWGNLSTQGEEFPDILHAVDLQIADFQQCASAYGGLEKTHICATVPGGKKDSCQGDSGGPLVASTKNESVLVGIVSFGDACASASHPGVYTKVSEYGSFIQQALSDTTNPDVEPNQPDPIDAEPLPDSDDVDEELQIENTLPSGDISISQLYAFELDNEYQDYADSLLEIYNTSNTEINVTDVQALTSQAIAIEYEDCTFAPLEPDESCYVELSWSRYDAESLDAEFSVEVYDGSTVKNQVIVLEQSMLQPVEAEDALDYTDADYYTNDSDQWETDDSDYTLGEQSLSSDLSDGQNLFLIGQFNEDGNFNLEFTYQLSGVTGYIYVNDKLKYELSASKEWQTATLMVPSDARIRWEFVATNRSDDNRKVRLDGFSVKPSTQTATLNAAGNGAGSNGLLTLLALTLIYLGRVARVGSIAATKG